MAMEEYQIRALGIVTNVHNRLKDLEARTLSKSE